MANGNAPSPIDRGRLKRTIAVRFVLAAVALGVMFFLPAGTLGYWQAWAYMGILLLPMALVLSYDLQKDPELLGRRLRRQAWRKGGRAAMLWSYPLFLATFLLPGLDRRFGWSAVPDWLVVAADAVVLAGYLLYVRVVHENPFLSAALEVAPGQELVDTGPYAVVRHPMYAAVMPLYLFSPLALGSFWAVLPAALLPLVIIARMFREERLLSRELAGYRKYARRVRYRLIPGVW